METTMITAPVEASAEGEIQQSEVERGLLLVARYAEAAYRPAGGKHRA